MAAYQSLYGYLFSQLTADTVQRYRGGSAGRRAGGNDFTRLIAPMLANVIFINTILAVSGSFKSFDLVYSMTGGGPAHFTEVIAVYMYNTTFVFQNYGYGSALAVIIIIFTVIALMISRAVTKRFDY